MIFHLNTYEDIDNNIFYYNILYYYVTIFNLDFKLRYNKYKHNIYVYILISLVSNKYVNIII